MGGTNRGMEVRTMNTLQLTRSRNNHPSTETQAPPTAKATASARNELCVRISLEETNLAIWKEYEAIWKEVP